MFTPWSIARLFVLVHERKLFLISTRSPSMESATTEDDYKPILLVEDNPDDEQRILQAFQKNDMDHIIHVTRDGLEALEYLFGSLEKPYLRFPAPKLVLLDLRLPRIDGLEVLQKIRQFPESQNLSVIVFTASRDETDRQKATSFIIDGYFLKPEDEKDFPKIMEKIGLTWLIENQ
jgi:two-component system, response regulator